jgi:DNA modification methylase
VRDRRCVVIAYDEGGVTVHLGDCREVLATLPDASVQTVVTSPPYYALRSYLPDGHQDKGCEIGLETTVETYVAEMVCVFREVRRVLADDGTLWLNLGDSYVAQSTAGDVNSSTLQGGQATQIEAWKRRGTVGSIDLPRKNLIGIPWRVAFALQADGWILRQDIIWAKPNPMPESVTDRCTKSHEYLFLLSKSPRYSFDAAAISESTSWDLSRAKTPDGWDTSTGEGGHGAFHRNGRERGSYNGSRFDRGKTAEHQEGRASTQERAEGAKRKKRSVWTIAPEPFAGAHFATFPRKLVEPCVLAGSRPGDVVLDPFAGSGTTLQVAKRLGRRAVGIELNPDYLPMIERRLAQHVIEFEVAS